MNSPGAASMLVRNMTAGAIRFCDRARVLEERRSGRPVNHVAGDADLVRTARRWRASTPGEQKGIEAELIYAECCAIGHGLSWKATKTLACALLAGPFRRMGGCPSPRRRGDCS